MADTDSKRTKINELIEYIESRLAELEEEKEELKEFQEKDKERRCLEYALYQRELEEVGETLEEIEEERRTEVHGTNTRREQFNTREKEIQVRIYFSVLIFLGSPKHACFHRIWRKPLKRPNTPSMRQQTC
jgi:chromosome segregation ATPase